MKSSLVFPWAIQVFDSSETWPNVFCLDQSESDMGNDDLILSNVTNIEIICFFA